MIQDIKKIFTILTIVFFAIISTNCKGDAQKKNNNFSDRFDTIYTPQNLTDTLRNNIELYNYYKLKDVERFFEKPIEPSDLEKFKQIELKIDDNKIYIKYDGNEGELSYQIKPTTAEKYFGKGSLYDYFNEFTKTNYNIDINKSLSYIDLKDKKTPLKEPFKTFFYKNSTIITDNYIFLYSYEDYVLVFEKNNTISSKLCNELKSQSISDKLTYDFIVEKIKINPISNSYKKFLKLDYLSHLNAIELPSINKNTKIVLVSAYQEAGEPNLYLYTLSKGCNVIEKFDLSYIEGENESGKIIGRQLKSIENNYTIHVTDFLETNQEVEKTYKINELGYFKELN